MAAVKPSEVNFLFLQSENQNAVSKYIWLIFREKNELIIDSDQIYIPYNCQFLVIEPYVNITDSYIAKEMYHTSETSFAISKRIFAIYNEITGFDVSEPDFYQRRLDLNKTVLEVYCDVSTKP